MDEFLDNNEFMGKAGKDNFSSADGFINNNETMEKAGKEYFSNVEAEQTKNYEDLKSVDETDKVLENSNHIAENEGGKTYKKWTNESDGASTLIGRFGKVANGVSNYLDVSKYAKYSNMSVEGALNKNYVMPLDKKGLKSLKGRMADAKKVTGLYDKIHETTKKYGLWMLVLCAILPFAIPAMLTVGFVLFAEYAVHEAVCRYEYDKIIKPLTVNGKNPYKAMSYSKGYKELEKLTADEVSYGDLMKSLAEQSKNEKDPKAKENVNKLVQTLLKQEMDKIEKNKQSDVFVEKDEETNIENADQVDFNAESADARAEKPEEVNEQLANEQPSVEETATKQSETKVEEPKDEETDSPKEENIANGEKGVVFRDAKEEKKALKVFEGDNKEQIVNDEPETVEEVKEEPTELKNKKEQEKNKDEEGQSL